MTGKNKLTGKMELVILWKAWISWFGHGFFCFERYVFTRSWLKADCRPCNFFDSFFFNCDFTYYYRNACTVCAKWKLLGEFPRDRHTGLEVSSTFFVILPKIKTIKQDMLLFVCIYHCLELEVRRNNLARLKGRRRLR